MPHITVILPTWNRSKWLEKSIESVLSQTFQDFELIVVDDASTDSSEESVGIKSVMGLNSAIINASQVPHMEIYRLMVMELLFMNMMVRRR